MMRTSQEAMTALPILYTYSHPVLCMKQRVLALGA